MTTDGHLRAGGRGGPALLLLHGLGSTGHVWDGWVPVLARRWPGRWLAPDLPGHGRADPLHRYSFGAAAAHVADLVSADERLVIVGHSMGGVVGLALASGWFGVRVDGVVGLGIKVSWSAEDLGKARSIAERPVAWFATRDEAVERYLRLSGLTGVLPADDPGVGSGVREEHGRWRLAQDPATFAVGAPDMAGLLAAARCPVRLARGEHDAMVSDEQLQALDGEAVSLPGLGHNAHVEQPEAVLRLVEPYLDPPGV